MAETEGVLNPRLQAVQDAISQAQALHAIMVGVQVDAVQMEQVVEKKITAAKNVYDAKVKQAEQVEKDKRAKVEAAQQRMEVEVEKKLAAAKAAHDIAITEVQDEKKEAVEAAQKRFNTASVEQLGRLSVVQKEAEQARLNLVNYQEEVRKTTGAVIDLMGVVGGGHTKL